MDGREDNEFERGKRKGTLKKEKGTHKKPKKETAEKGEGRQKT